MRSNSKTRSAKIHPDHCDGSRASANSLRLRRPYSSSAIPPPATTSLANSLPRFMRAERRGPCRRKVCLASIKQPVLPPPSASHGMRRTRRSTRKRSACSLPSGRSQAERSSSRTVDPSTMSTACEQRLGDSCALVIGPADMQSPAASLRLDTTSLSPSSRRNTLPFLPIHSRTPHHGLTTLPTAHPERAQRAVSVFITSMTGCCSISPIRPWLSSACPTLSFRFLSPRFKPDSPLSISLLRRAYLLPLPSNRTRQWKVRMGKMTAHRRQGRL